MFKTQKIARTGAFALFGALYLAAFSSLDLNPLIRNQVALIPVQVGVLIYFFWWRSRKAESLDTHKGYPYETHRIKEKNP